MKTKKKSTKAIIVSFSDLFKILSTISMVITIIVSFLMILVSVVLPPLIKNIDIKNGVVTYENTKIEMFVDTNYVLNIKVGDETKSSIQLDESSAIEAVQFINNLTTNKLIGFLETIFILAIVELILLTIIYNKSRKLFKQMRIEKTPFTKESHCLIKSVASLLLSIFIIDIISKFALSHITDYPITVNFSFSNLIFILAIFFLAYIFKYGNRLENKEG